MSTGHDPRAHLSAHARRKRVRARCETFTEITQLVPCELSASGTHRVHVTIGNDGQFMGLRCQCDLEHGEDDEAVKRLACPNCGTIPGHRKRKASASMAAYRLGHQGTCGHAMGLVRSYIAGKTTVEEEHLLQTLFPNCTSAFQKARRRAEEGRTGNRTYKPAEYDRGTEQMLNARASKGAKVAVQVKLHKTKRVPIGANVGEHVVARRALGTAWLLVPAGIKATMEAAGKKERSRGFRRHKTVHCLICDRDIEGTAQIKAHFGSARHRVKYENALLEALGALPGCGEG